MDGKVCLRFRGKHCWVMKTNFFFSKQVNFPAYNLNFHWGECDGIESRLSSWIFSTLIWVSLCIQTQFVYYRMDPFGKLAHSGKWLIVWQEPLVGHCRERGGLNSWILFEARGYLFNPRSFFYWSIFYQISLTMKIQVEFPFLWPFYLLPPNFTTYSRKT